MERVRKPVRDFLRCDVLFAEFRDDGGLTKMN